MRVRVKIRVKTRAKAKIRARAEPKARAKARAVIGSQDKAKLIVRKILPIIKLSMGS